MRFSLFAEKFSTQSGIGLLMQDLADASEAKDHMFMFGGGAPSYIPQVAQVFRNCMQKLIANGKQFDRAVGTYDPPQGNTAFIDALAHMLNQKYGWAVASSNIALTNGSQQAFFILLNMFAGDYADGTRKKILFPMTPEYIGYCDVGLSDDLFESVPPAIKFVDDFFFKYQINFDELNIHDHIGAICISRPTNPTGNVLTDEEVTKLAQYAKAKGVPLIIDNAYGKPFPDITFTDVTPYWDENCILCMSLSKLGMAGTRTGIVIGPESVIQRITRFNAVISLAPGGIGTAIATKLIKDETILSMSREYIQPFYEEKMTTAVSLAQHYFAGMDVAIHKPEGTFFLWVWFKTLNGSCHQLYKHLKQRGVIVVPGNYFFFGLQEPHPHQNQCLRIHHSQPIEVIEAAFQIIAEEAAQMA